MATNSNEIQPLPLSDLSLALYETYLPNAFDESLTILEKMNKLLARLQLIEKVLQSLIDYINTGIIPPTDPPPEPEPVEKILLSETLNFTVGTGGDFATIQEGLNYCTTRLNAWNGKVNLNLVAGFVMKEQVLVQNRDLSFVTINRADTTHTIDVTSLTKTYAINQSPEFSVTPAFTGLSARMPKLNVQFKMSSKSGSVNTYTGIYLNNSSMDLLPSSGVTDSNFIGIVAISGSVVNAPYSDFSNSGNREQTNVTNYDTIRYGDCYRIWNSTLTAPYSNADRGGDIGFNINMASTANINYSHANDTTHHGIMSSTGSSVSARNCTVNDVIDDAVVAYAGSSIDLRNSTMNNTLKGSGLVATRSSSVNFENGITNNCYNGGIYVNRGSSVDAEGAVVTNCTKDNVTCANGSMLNFNNATSTGSKQDNLHCNHGFNVTAFMANLSNAGECGILGYGAGTISAENSTIQNCKIRAVEASSGAVINMRGAQTGGSLGGSDLSIYYGSVINAYNATGTQNRTLNTLSSNGIIYKV